MTPVELVRWALAVLVCVVVLAVIALLIGATIAGIRNANRKVKQQPNDH